MDVEIGSKDAKSNLSRLIAAAQKGRRVYLVNRGKRVVELVPVANGANSARGRGMLKHRISLPPGWGSQEQRERDEKEFLDQLGIA